MNVGGIPTRALEAGADLASISVIDQTALPATFTRVSLRTVNEVVAAIKDMVVRGAPLIGVTGAYGLALALRDDASDAGLETAFEHLVTARPTAVNLRWALERIRKAVQPLPAQQRAQAAFSFATVMAEKDVATGKSLATHGLPLLENAWKNKDRPLNILTHCNAGWLATVDWGTALAPIFLAHDRGMNVHVWVDETRPRNQGYLTAWELREHGIPHTVIVDNAGGLLMRRGQVDLCIVGTDRTTRSGDVCNKIGTYLKALAAKDNDIPFYVAAPLSSIDLTIDDGAKIPIEDRDAREVTHIGGVQQLHGSSVANPGFDVTPARLVTALITEKGVCAPNAEAIERLFT